MKNQKILITGATGFVGSNLARRLLEFGNTVNIIARENSGYENIKDIENRLGIFVYDGNISNLIGYMKREQFDAVFHLASVCIVEHKSPDIDTLIDSNIKFGTHLLEAMKESETNILINTGTSWQNYNNEEYNPVDLYAATKQAFQSIIKFYTEMANIRCITLKLFDTYGENDKRLKLINLLNKFADEGTNFDMTPGEQLVNLVHVNDVVEAFIIAYENLKNDTCIVNEEFAVTEGESTKLKDVITLFEKVSGKKVNINWGGRPYRQREVMVPYSSYKKLPNWEPKITLAEGLSRFK